MDGRSLGMMLIGAGALLALAGGLFLAGALDWVGRLPGDIRIHSGSTRVFIPLTTMLILSLLLTAVLAIIRRFF
jgi:hypothetical protein